MRSSPISDRPNIVLVFVDNHPADMMGCSGNAEIHTPHLDALAQKATRFSNAFCPNAMCSPCRASVLTGLMPSQHGVHTWLDDSVVSEWPDAWSAIGEFETLPERLASRGYHTALMGKYHLGIAEHPQNGFHEWVTLQIGHVLSFYDNDIIDNGKHYRCAGHSVDFFTEKAVEYLAKRSDRREQPFFLYLTYPAPYGHWPSVKGPPANRFADLYRDTPMYSVPREGLSKQLIDWILVRHDKVRDDDPFYPELAQIPNDLPTLRNYYAQMSMVDDGVGQVLAALNHHGLTDETLFIYTSDHGMSLGQHGFWGHGEDTWPSNTHREANHIPLIVKPPGAGGDGRVLNSLVGTTDIFATILDFAGAGRPPRIQSPSRSMRTLIEAQETEWENEVFMEQEETRAVRTPGWLFMQRFAPTPYDFCNELYDLKDDPGERNNLISEPGCQDVVAALTERIERFFSTYSNRKWDLWRGGTVKSNSTRPFLWREVWGPDWKPMY